MSTADEPKRRLSRRQSEVLQLTAQGMAATAVAAKMGISPNTVKLYRSQLHAILNVHDRAQLLARAEHLGLLK